MLPTKCICGGKSNGPLAHARGSRCSLSTVKGYSYNVLIPDLTYYATNEAFTVERENGKYLDAMPDLVVEIVSASSQRTDR